MNDEVSTEVANGKHVVPKGVGVEELDGGKKKLAEECPADLRLLLESKGMMETYNKLVQAVVDESKTRSFGSWKDKEFESIVDFFREDFAEGDIKVALCKRKSGSGTYRWLEFIDVTVAEGYVPQYDVANFSGQVIKTVYKKIEFPNGVAVKELKQWGKARQKLREKTPVYVEKLLEPKGLMEEYKIMVEHCADAGVGQRLKMWNIEKLKNIIEFHRPNFEAKGVSLFISHKQEYVLHGLDAGDHEYFRWIEFVDREQQPNYYPQRDADTKDEKCIIS